MPYVGGRARLLSDQIYLSLLALKRTFNPKSRVHLTGIPGKGVARRSLVNTASHSWLIEVVVMFISDVGVVLNVHGVITVYYYTTVCVASSSL